MIPSIGEISGGPKEDDRIDSIPLSTATEEQLNNSLVEPRHSKRSHPDMNDLKNHFGCYHCLRINTMENFGMNSSIKDMYHCPVSPSAIPFQNIIKVQTEQ